MDQEPNESSPAKQALNKGGIIAGSVYFVLLILFIISRFVLRQGPGGWSDPPAYDDVLWLGMGICISIMGFSYGRLSWTMSGEEYARWFRNQPGGALLADFVFEHRRYLLWQARLLWPLVAALGAALAVFMAYSILFRWSMR